MTNQENIIVLLKNLFSFYLSCSLLDAFRSFILYKKENIEMDNTEIINKLVQINQSELSLCVKSLLKDFLSNNSFRYELIFKDLNEFLLSCSKIENNLKKIFKPKIHESLVPFLDNQENFDKFFYKINVLRSIITKAIISEVW